VRFNLPNVTVERITWLAFQPPAMFVVQPSSGGIALLPLMLPLALLLPLARCVDVTLLSRQRGAALHPFMVEPFTVYALYCALCCFGAPWQVFTWGSAAHSRLGCDSAARLAAEPLRARLKGGTTGRDRNDQLIQPVPSSERLQTVPFLLDALTHGQHVNEVVRGPGLLCCWCCCKDTLSYRSLAPTFDFCLFGCLFVWFVCGL